MHLDQIKRFIASLDIKSEVKSLLVSESVLEKHAFYLQLPYFLSPLFPAIAEDRLHNLAGYSYLYFRFTLEVDRLLDEQVDSVSYLTRLFTCLSIHEHAIQGLTQLFPVGNSFWSLFELCKDEYISSNMREKQMSITRTGFSEDVFEQIASGKSAICYAIAYAMGNLSGNSEPVSKICSCLKHLHIAMQYIDDIQDLKQDWQQNQYTYAHFLVERYLRNNGLEINQLSVTALYQHCYASGIAQFLLARCHHHFSHSLAIAHALDLPALSLHIQSQLDGCKVYQQEVNQLLEKTKVKASKSYTLLPQASSTYSSSLIRDAASRALGYMQHNLDNQGCWVDFLTSAGQSKMWTTAYAGLLLAETKDGRNMANSAFDASFLLPSSYNEGIMQDGDSTNFGMGLRRKAQGDITPQQISSWLTFMDADGGWVTYRDSDQLRKMMKMPNQVSVAGWLTPKSCVTAAAAYVMTLFEELGPQRKSSCEYLVRHQHADGYWSSYWWTSPIYATAFAILALASLPEYEECRAKALRWLATQQTADGAWCDEYTTIQPSAFFTGLAVKALLTGSAQDYSAAVKKGINWLMSNQMDDGSWLTTRILRIPATDVADPSNVKHWRLSSFGINVVVDDHNRIFTTSTIFNALSIYAEKEVTFTNIS